MMKHANCEQLPEDLVYTIFLNLPVKTLLRFQSLSRRWNRIIAGRAFGKHHYLHNNNGNSKLRADHVFIHPLFPNSPDDQVAVHYTMTTTTKEMKKQTSAAWCVCYDDHDHDHSERCVPPPPFTGIDWLPDPLLSEPRERWFVSSSCHGMVCMTHHRHPAAAAIFIWNPFTRQRRHVPWPGLDRSFLAVSQSFVGFGYDHVTDDYKIVVSTGQKFAVAGPFGSEHPGITYVMALRDNNAWRRVDEVVFPFAGSLELEQPVAYLNGEAYWISRTVRANLTAPEGVGRRYVIPKFNFADETLAILPPPRGLGPGRNWWVRLGQYKESLCFFDFHHGWPRQAPDWIIHVWSLRGEQGSGDGGITWSKVMSVPLMCKGVSYNRREPWGFTIDGDLIMKISFDNNGLFTFLVEEGRFVDLLRDDHIQLGAMEDQAVHHLQMETLISPLSAF
uniref:F-box domain-containing protein n=1 Tax=Kalanchoe fedtschenkoi TaxID=63787 RepID=A0A7N1A336_KALFE